MNTETAIALYGAYGSFFYFHLSFPPYIKLIAGNGVMSSKQSPEGDQNSHIPFGICLETSKHCLVVSTRRKTDHFPARKNASVSLAGEISPDPLVLLRNPER